VAGDRRVGYPLDIEASDLGGHLEADQVEIPVLRSADLGRLVEDVLFPRMKAPEEFLAAAAVGSWAVVAAARMDWSPLTSAVV
jgi:hypothetical protein